VGKPTGRWETLSTLAALVAEPGPNILATPFLGNLWEIQNAVC